jgi:hypothetical protein
MSPTLSTALRDVREALSELELAMADSEPAPFSVVLTKDRSSGRIHRRGRIVDIPGLMSFEGCNLDQAGTFDVIPDLSHVSDESVLCVNCFGPSDPGDHD